METTISFIKNGVRVLHRASRGEYSFANPNVVEMSSSVFSNDYDSFGCDKYRLLEDKRKIASDLRRSFEKITN